MPPETLQGAWVWAPESALCLPKLFFWCSCPPRGPGARDNAHNQIVSSRNSQSTLDSEQELEQQEHAELTEVIALSPEEAKRLLVSGRWPCSILAPLRAQDGGGHRERPMPLRSPVPWDVVVEGDRDPKRGRGCCAGRPPPWCVDRRSVDCPCLIVCSVVTASSGSGTGPARSGRSMPAE